MGGGVSLIDGHIDEPKCCENYVYNFETNCNHENELLDSIDFEPDDIDKTVFLARKEAEKALERSKGNA